MLVEEGLLAEELARKLLSWKHSGFSVHNGKPVKRNDTDGLKRVAQYIIRNPFSEQKMTYNEENGTVIYRSRMHAKTKRNFEIFSAEDFIAAITQHPSSPFGLRRDKYTGKGIPNGEVLWLVFKPCPGRTCEATGRRI